MNLRLLGKGGGEGLVGGVGGAVGGVGGAVGAGTMGSFSGSHNRRLFIALLPPSPAHTHLSTAPTAKLNEL